MNHMTFGHTVFIIDDLYNHSPEFFKYFKEKYPSALLSFFKKDGKSDFIVNVEKITVEALSTMRLSYEHDVVLCFAETQINDDPLLCIPFIRSEDDSEVNNFPTINAFVFPQIQMEDYDTLMHDITFTILSRFGVDHFHRKVFISYRRREREALALDLLAKLSSDKSGFEVFLDTRKLDVGVHFMDDIRNAISQTDVFLLLYSPTYMTTPFTQKEFYTALTAGAGIIVLCEGTPDDFKDDKCFPNGLPTLFYSSDSNVDFTDGKLQELIRIMNTERQNFKKHKMYRFGRMTNKLKMVSLSSFATTAKGSDAKEFVYPLYCPPTSLDLQRIENQAAHDKGSHVIIYDHWAIPQTYDDNIRWIMEKKHIALRTLQECYMQTSGNESVQSVRPVVFLSASIPEFSGQLKCNFAFIHEIIVTLVEEVINRRGTLVFGGHPTITPIIMNMMELYQQKNNGEYPDIKLYQSEFFKEKFSPEVYDFPADNLVIVEKAGISSDEKKCKAESLQKMRETMLDRDGHVPFTHGVFIGGVVKEDKTCGVWTECEMFHSRYPDAPCVTFEDTGTDLKKISGIAGDGVFKQLLKIEDFVNLFNSK